jgi:hypothetical protein
MNVVKEVVHPLIEVYAYRFAASHQRVNHSSIFSCFMIAAEEIVLAALCWHYIYVGIIE